jgi:hypothetical protein
MRVGHSNLDGNGKRSEIWVFFSVANYSTGSRTRTTRYDGPGEGAATVKETALAWDTRIKELDDADLDNFSKDAYRVWSSYFGPATIDLWAERQNRKRRARYQDKRGAKKQRTLSNSPAPRTETIDTTAELSDEQLAVHFYKYDSPFSTTGYTRIAELVRSKFELSVSPPVEMLLNLRQKAKKYAPEPPTLIWEDMQYQAWLRSALKQKKGEKKDEDRSHTPGVAYAAFAANLQKTFDLFECYRARWASKGEESQA